MQPIMAHTSSKSLVELNTGEHETTFVNITQMLSSLTRTPRLKWLDNLSPLHQPQKLYSYSKHLLLLQYNHLLLLQHPSKLQPEALQQQPAPSGRPVTTDVHPPTSRTDVTPRRSGRVSKAPQHLIEHM